MKNVAQLCLAALPWLLFLLTPEGWCQQRVDCQWGPYGEWSACDGCTRLQSRSRSMAVYAQFGGNVCQGSRAESRPCETTQGCPLEEGCGNRFRCRSGKCVSQSLVCNGDQDCEEDGEDENRCDPLRRYVSCPHSSLPPNIELLGNGFDLVSGRWRGGVINTKSFGGQCRSIYSGVHSSIYRLPLSTTGFSFMVNVQNDFSDETFESKWHYAKDIVNRETVTGTTSGYRNYDFHESQDKARAHKLLILKNAIEVAQFQSTSPKYLPISEEFWNVLAKLPNVYDYAAYRKVLERFGTHYASEGSLGGSFKMFVMIDEETEKQMARTSEQYDECSRTKRWFLFIPITTERCKRGQSQSSSSSGSGRSNRVAKVEPVGGGVAHIAALQNIQLSNLDRNWELYSNWADSIRSFPQVTKQKLRPLSELVKEVQCAGVKKLYLRAAIEQYLTESDPCHCRPCHNNGLAVIDGDECKCICKPGTSGLACEVGSEIEGQHGVIDGSWSCWSSWSTCSGQKRSRRRSCSNPAPHNGGQSCIGEPTEASDCEDQDIAYLKTMEPQCFDQTLPASQMCGDPPVLINGYILDPKDVYLVGSKVEYTCAGNHKLLGNSIIVCNADRTWSASPGLCTVSACTLLSLTEGVIATPFKGAYDIGEMVTLSCPEGRRLEGAAAVICDPSLNFSPDPEDSRCTAVNVQPSQVDPPAQCRTWEKLSRGKCVCKMPFECSSSLQLCASNREHGTWTLLTVCKLHALQCMKHGHVVAAESGCVWPPRGARACPDCEMWETCDGQAGECRCRDAADCVVPGASLCVRVGEDVAAAPAQTMTECEAGVRRCRGEKVSLMSIWPCTPAT